MTTPKKPDIHPLFLPNDDDDAEDRREIWRIFVVRNEQRGPVRSPRFFLPHEMRELSDLYSTFGGGSYELIAVTDDGRIFRKRRYMLDGPSKSMSGDPEPTTSAVALAATTTPAANALPAGVDPMLAFMFQMQQSQTQMMVAVISAIAGRPPPAAPPTSTVAETMAAVGSILQAVRPAPAAPSTPMTEVLGVMNAIDTAAERRTQAAREAARDQAPGESTVDVVKAVGEMAMPLLAAAANAAAKGGGGVPPVPALG